MPAPQSDAIHVLVAEDEPLAAEALADTLSFHGYTVTVALDGLQALACIAARMPDVMIADLRMPGMNGADMIRNARRAKAGLPVVIVTGNPEIWNRTATPEDRNRVTVLCKPASPRAILDAVAASVH